MEISFLLSRLISTNHTGFVKKGNINDNILLPQKALGLLNVKKRAGHIPVKLDLSKTYDKLCETFCLSIGEIWILL